MANSKSQVITDLDAARPVMQRVSRHGGRVRYFSTPGTVTLPAAGSTIGDVHRLLRVSSGDVIVGLKLHCIGSSTTGDADLGLYLARDGVVVDADFFKAAFSITNNTAASSTALADHRLINSTVGGARFGLEDLGKPLWQALGLSADPMVEYDIALTITTAITGPDEVVALEMLVAQNS